VPLRNKQLLEAEEEAAHYKHLLFVVTSRYNKKSYKKTTMRKKKTNNSLRQKRKQHVKTRRRSKTKLDDGKEFERDCNCTTYETNKGKIERCNCTEVTRTL
jgi:hypothetical protein